MDGVKTLPLRVLYTVNTSPQYVLAKSQHDVPVNIVQEPPGDINRASSSQVYGRTGLQFCAMALCQSSPEIIPDGTKDYSVYVLDPLEDIQSKARYGSAAANSRGVAVGMGLLSGVLNPHLPTTLQVTGTVIGCDTEDAALEVVISLRQVQAIPSFMHQIPPPHLSSMNPYAVPPPNPKRKQSSSRSKEDASKPIFATNPLPPFSERMSQKAEETMAMSNGPPYHMPPSQFNQHYYYPPHPGYLGQIPPMMPPQYYAPPRDPAKDTVAALLPTPYIGPPKRPPGRPKRSPSPSGIIEITDSPKTTPSITVSESDSASDLLPSSDASDADISSCSTPEPQAQPLDTSAAQNAAILSALSSVSSKVDLTSIGGGAPSPELVNLLKLYLAAIESQSKPPEIINNESTTSAPAAAPSPSGTESGKENADPSSSSRKSAGKPTGPSSVIPPAAVPLGIGVYNSRTPKNANTEVHKQSENGRKRRLSDCAEKDSQLASNRRAAIASSASGLRQSNVHIGASSGASGPFPSQPALKPPFFARKPFFSATSGSSLLITSRKGPYVVPEWARGVPAPSPPRRSTMEDVMDKKSKARKAEKLRKSKSMSRLGGKNHGAQTSPARPTAERSAEMNEFERMLSESLSDAPEPPVEPMKSPKVASSTLTARMPLIAQSSPISGATKSSVLRAFDTSPLRPMRSRTSSGEAPPPSTPLRASSNPDGETEESSSPLFTPSPSIASARKEAPRKLVGFDVPPSPSPTYRRRKPPSPVKASNNDSEAEDSDSRSNSLPIASDDDFVFKRPATPTTPRPRERFDWKSLDLPPSSPPRTSPVMEPMDLPDDDVEMSTTDTPSSDSMQETEPSSEEGLPSSSSEMPSTPKPNAQRRESNIGTSWPTFPENIDFSDATDMMMFPDLGACPTDFQMPTSLGEVTPSTKAMFEALQNGLGEEDFSEAWKLVNDVMQPPLHSLDQGFGALEQSWFGETKIFEAGSEAASADDGTVDENKGEADLASMAATAFEDLLSGCLV